MANHVWFCSDHHFGHKNIIKWEGPNGDPARSIFESIEDHNETIIQNHNKVVKQLDRVYLLGDVCWNQRSLECLKRLNGQKILIMGNHDAQASKQFIGCVNRVAGALSICKPGLNAIMTHIPVHPQQLEYRFKYNIHGHMHCHTLDDPRYLNVSMEQIDYTPIELEEVKNRLEKQIKDFEQDLERCFP